MYKITYAFLSVYFYISKSVSIKTIYYFLQIDSVNLKMKSDEEIR